MTEQEKYGAQIKQALDAIKNLKQQLQQEKSRHHEPIAIVGMAFRFPGNANSYETLSNILLKNIDTIQDIPEERYNNSKIYDEAGSIGKSVLKQGGYLNDIDIFDASFFDLTRIETESLDPQQRILLELTQEALDNAGLETKSLVNSETGVFIGITSIDYQKKHFRSGDYNLVNPYSYTGSAVCANAGRISYIFGFQGPSVSIDTACSSSLVATHLAVQSLRKGESNLAIAGAANLILEPELSICFTALSGLSKDSRCRPFSNNANGFVRSEGAAIIILKRLNDAIQDKDNILAVIKGSAVNQDGKSNGFTAPSVLAQTKLIQTAIKDAQIDANDIEYIEAHGTGTKIGDPIELEALSNVFENIKSNKNPLKIASIKSNIGHTESVAGLAGLIKNIISINNKILPKNLHCDELNQFVDWESLPIKVVQENTTWQPENKYIGVSSFGVTGTNAHVIIGHHHQENEPIYLRDDIYILPLSAKSESALNDLLNKYIEFLRNTTFDLKDICAMAALRRTHYKYRKLFVANSKNDLIEEIKSALPFEYNVDVKYEEEVVLKTVFVFPGQGAQWVGMARKLMQHEPVFKQSLEEFNILLKKYVDWDLFNVLNSDDEIKLNQLDIVQPTLIAISIALAKLWQSLGFYPDAVVGHSMGEVAAAYIANIITLEEAVNIICTRSKLMLQVSGKGMMIATDLSYEEATKYIENAKDKVSIAVVNSNNSSVLSGDVDEILRLFDVLEMDERFVAKIKVDVASHSVHMEGIDEQLKSALKDINPKDSNIEFYSSVLKCKINGSNLNAEYWKQNLRQTVEFKDATFQLFKNNKCVCIEMSSHPTLTLALNNNILDAQSQSIYTGSFTKGKNDVIELYKNLGKLYEHNININWKNIYPNINKFIQLPNYPWQKERYWFDEKPQFKANYDPINTQTNSLENLYKIDWEKVDISNHVIENKNILFVCLSHENNFINNIKSVLDKNNNLYAEFNHDVQFDYVIISCFKEDNHSNIESIIKLQETIKYFSSNKQTPNFILLSSNAIVLDEDKILNSNATILSGIFRTLQNEENSFHFKHIDIDDTEDILLPLKCLNSNNHFTEIVIRNNQTYIPKLNKLNAISTNELNVDKESTILIVGGTSGLGLQMAIDYSNKGYKNIALVSRSGAKEETNAAIEIFNQNDTKIAILKADYTNTNVVEDSIKAIEKSMPAIKTVVHAAVVLADSLFQDIEKHDIEKIIASKVIIANNIHTYFKYNTAVRIIFFSSAASILGTLAQAVYAGVNHYLDNLAKLINNQGGHAIAVNWGNIAEIGLAAQDEKRGQNLLEQGLGLIFKHELAPIFHIIHHQNIHQVIPLKIDFDKWKNNYPITKMNILYSNFIEQDNNIQNNNKNNLDIFSCRSLDEALVSIQHNIKQHISAITKIQSSKIKHDETFKSLGIDSLMALQLKNKIQADYNLQLNVSSVWSYPTVEKYSNFLSDELDLQSKYVQHNVQEPINSNSFESEVNELSIEELMKQLNEKL